MIPNFDTWTAKLVAIRSGKLDSFVRTYPPAAKFKVKTDIGNSCFVWFLLSDDYPDDALIRTLACRAVEEAIKDYKDENGLL